MTDETTSEEQVNDPLEEMEHKYKLALADYQNLLKQSAKEKSELVMYANKNLILDILQVYDNLKLSFQHFPESSGAQWKTGLDHILQQFKKILEDNHVKEIETKDKKFDHELMDAVETRETDDESKDELVAEELKGGYQLHKQVISPARVAVYKLK